MIARGRLGKTRERGTDATGRRCCGESDVWRRWPELPASPWPASDAHRHSLRHAPPLRSSRYRVPSPHPLPDQARPPRSDVLRDPHDGSLDGRARAAQVDSRGPRQGAAQGQGGGGIPPKAPPFARMLHSPASPAVRAGAAPIIAPWRRAALPHPLDAARLLPRLVRTSKSVQGRHATR